MIWKRPSEFQLPGEDQPIGCEREPNQLRSHIPGQIARHQMLRIFRTLRLVERHDFFHIHRHAQRFGCNRNPFRDGNSRQ